MAAGSGHQHPAWNRTVDQRAISRLSDKDAVTPPDRAKEMASAIPGARLEIVEGAGHLTPMEQPDVVERLLTEWLTD